MAAQALLLAAGAAVVRQGAALNAWLGSSTSASPFAFPPSSWDAGGAAFSARVAGPILCTMALQVCLLMAECWNSAVAVKRAQVARERRRGKAE